MSFDRKWQIMQQIVLSNPKPFPKTTFLTFNRFITENILIILLQYMGLTLTTLSSHPALLWPASGTACAFAFLRGYSILPGVFLGSFLAYFFAHASIFISGQCAMLFTLQTASLLFLSYRFVGPMLFYYSIHRFLKFIFISIVITLISSFLMIFVCQNQLTYLNFYFDGMQWWFANLNGLLLFAFAIVAWDLVFPDLHALQNKIIIKMSLIVMTMLLTATLMFFTSSIALFCFLTMILFTLNLIISIYFGWLGTVSALFLLGMTLIILESISLSRWLIYYDILLASISIINLSIAVHFYKKIA